MSERVELRQAQAVIKRLTARVEAAEAEVEWMRQEARAEKAHAGPDVECPVCTHLMIEQQIERAETAEATLAKVRALHHSTNDGYCDECSWRWPCETIALLNREIGP